MKTSAPAAFEAIAKAHLAESWERYPERASALGLADFNSRLGKNSPDVHREEAAADAATLAKVEALPGSAFSGDDWLDRRAFLSELRTSRLFATTFPRWQDNPQVHCDAAVSSIFDLVSRHTSNLASVAPAINERLRLLPSFLKEGGRCLNRPIPLWTALASQSCSGAIEFLDGLAPELERVSKSRTAPLIAGTKQAFADYAKAASRKAPGKKSGFAIGTDAFEFLIRERLGLDWSLGEARAEGARLVAESRDAVNREARRLGYRDARSAMEDFSGRWDPGVSLLEAYRKTTSELRTLIQKRGLATLPPNERLDVLPAPPFLRHQFPTAAYSAPPPFSKSQRGIFWVNDLSLGITNPELRAREIRQHFGLELTSAHEAYPGHHLQFALQNRHRSKLRRIFAHSIFYEGWTMWCEEFVVSEGLVNHPAARLIQLHDTLWRACRIVIDCGLHSGEMTPSAAARFLVDNVGFTPARARGDVNWYTSAPTVPMSYLLGRLEVEKLHTRFVNGEGWSLKKFNDWMLSHGAVPWSWILQIRPASMMHCR